jgi:hypothetical protein
MPHSINYWHVDSCGQGMLLSVQGIDEEVSHYRDAILDLESSLKSTTLKDKLWGVQLWLH